jgi:hypothetical protein
MGWCATHTRETAAYLQPLQHRDPRRGRLRCGGAVGVLCRSRALVPAAQPSHTSAELSKSSYLSLLESSRCWAGWNGPDPNAAAWVPSGKHATHMRLPQIQSHLEAMSSSCAAPSPASMRASAASSASTFRSARSCRCACQVLSRQLGSLSGPEMGTTCPCSRCACCCQTGADPRVGAEQWMQRPSRRVACSAYWNSKAMSEAAAPPECCRRPPLPSCRHPGVEVAREPRRWKGVLPPGRLLPPRRRRCCSAHRDITL